jgi:uncharacterized membrane protein
MSAIIIASVILALMPVVGVIMIFSVNSKVTGIGDSIKDLKDRMISLETAIRGLRAAPDEYAEFPQTPAEEASPPAPIVDEPPLEIVEPPRIIFTPPPPAVMPETAPRHTERLPAPSPAEPTWFSKKTAALFKWLIGEGNIWVTVGVLLFLAGFGLLFSYAVQMGWLPLEFRLAGASVVGMAMTALGWRMRDRRRIYALILQGGGIGVLYIVLLAGAKLGPVIPIAGAVLGMLALSAFTVALALLQDFEPLALFALLGGYAAPILVSSGSSNFVALFSIHALLNFEILIISLFRDWRKTRWSGLLASVAVGVAWGLLRWQERYFPSVEPFLILFFVNYSAIALIPMFSRKIEPVMGGFSLFRYGRIDLPMIATAPFILVFLQMSAAAHTKYTVAITCLLTGAWHLALGAISTKYFRETDRDAPPGVIYPRGLFLAYCVIFSNMAIPFVFARASASSIWTVEAAVIIAIASRRRSAGVLSCGLLLHAAAFVVYNFAPYLRLPVSPAEHSFTATGIIFALSSLASSYFLARLSNETFERSVARLPGISIRVPAPDILSWALSLYGVAWWTLAVWDASDLLHMAGFSSFLPFCVGGAAGYVMSSPYMFRRGNGLSAAPSWAPARALALPPVAAGCVYAIYGFLAFAAVNANKSYGVLMPLDRLFTYNTSVSAIYRDLSRNFSVNWAAFAALFYASSAIYRSAAATSLRKIAWGCVLLSFTTYSSSALSVSLVSAFPQWSEVGGIGYLGWFLPIFAATVVTALRRFEGRIVGKEYRAAGLIALTLMMVFKIPEFIICIGEAGEWITRYVPLLNSLELWQALYIASAAIIMDSALKGGARRVGLLRAVPLVTFLWLNSVAARASLHYFGEMVRFGRMSDAPHFQGLLAILWGVSSLALIFAGKRFENRTPWLMGAALLALDIAKLLLIDLRNSATVIRIFAFLILGGFFLLIGWIAPLPPKTSKREEREP